MNSRLSLWGVPAILIVLALSPRQSFAAPPATAVTCQLKATAISFGVYDVFSDVLKTASSSLTITCNNVRDPVWVSVQVTLSAGNSGNAAQRFMSGSVAGSNLYYNLYYPDFSTVLGDGVSGSVAVNLVNKANPWTMTVNGSIPVKQNAPPGTYTDTLTATILY